MSGTPDPKPRRRIVLPNPKYLELVRALLERFRVCELCGLRPSESAHHVVSRAQGGDDVAENLVALCGSGTTGCHGRVEEDRLARFGLRQRLRPELVAYAIERKGSGWFDQKYPGQA